MPSVSSCCFCLLAFVLFAGAYMILCCFPQGVAQTLRIRTLVCACVFVFATRLAVWQPRFARMERSVAAPMVVPTAARRTRETAGNAAPLPSAARGSRRPVKPSIVFLDQEEYCYYWNHNFCQCIERGFTTQRDATDAWTAWSQATDPDGDGDWLLCPGGVLRVCVRLYWREGALVIACVPFVCIAFYCYARRARWRFVYCGGVGLYVHSTAVCVLQSIPTSAP